MSKLLKTYSRKLNKLYFNILKKRNDNIQYIKKNIAMISDIKPTNILYYKLDNNINKHINNILDTDFDILVIYSNEKIDYKFDFVPLYPIYLEYNNNKMFILSSLQVESLNGFNVYCSDEKEFYNDFIYRSRIQYGAIISNKNNIKPSFFELTMSGFKEKYRKGILANYKIHKCRNISYIVPYDHGWMATGTRNSLEYGLKKFKPKVVVELGTWLGTSSKFMKDTDPNIKLYCFDIFQPILDTQYKFKKYNPMDKFYFNIPRLETFNRNMGDHKDVYAIKTSIDIDEVISLFKNNKVQVDIFYIDFEKNPDKLNRVIMKLTNSFPNSTIIGDDLICGNTKQCIFNQLLSSNKKFALSENSYIISSQIMKDYLEIVKKEMGKAKNYNKMEEIFISKIMNNIISNIDQNYFRLFIEICLKNKRYYLLLKFFKNYKIDLNSKKYFIGDNKNTIYHVICREIRKMKLTNIINLFTSYQKINNDFNLLLLTPTDYLKYDIYFN